jgi:hypothetical protein
VSQPLGPSWRAVLVGWVIIAGLGMTHAWKTQELLATASHVERPHAAESTPFTLLNFNDALDGKTWVRLTTDWVETPGAWRLRYTMNDNAPEGREVRWSSGWSWWLAGMGAVNRLLTAEPWPRAIEEASVWAGLPVLLLGVGWFSWWIGRRLGWGVGALATLGLFGHPGMYEGFWPANPDHHGVLAFATLGCLLGVLLAGGGFWRADGADGIFTGQESQARRAMIVSALSGAVGLWVGALSVFPAIAMVALAGLVSVLWFGRRLHDEGFTFAPGLWRLWGRVGGMASLALYLVENAPDRLGMRLEVNHPAYAVAWWAGAELVARVGERWLEKPALPDARFRRWCVATAPYLVLAGLPAMLAFLGPVSWFVLRDPVVWEFHRRVSEIQPIWSPGIHSYLVVMFLVMTVPVWAALVWLVRGTAPLPSRVGVGFVALVATLATAEACVHVRWYMMASGSQVLLALLLARTIFLSGKRIRPAWLRWGGVLGLGAALYLPWRIFDLREAWDPNAVKHDLVDDWIMRDLAAALRATHDASTVVLLADGNVSSRIGYFGRIKAVGTLYWENARGLRAADEIFAATDEKEVERLLRERQVTHIVVRNGQENFAGTSSLVGPKPEGASAFGRWLARQHEPPLWLRYLPYRPPEILPTVDERMLVFKVDFTQPRAEAYYRRAGLHLSFDETEDAFRDLERSARLAPDNPAPWSMLDGLARSLGGRGRVQEALDVYQRALAIAMQTGQLPQAEAFRRALTRGPP